MSLKKLSDPDDGLQEDLDSYTLEILEEEGIKMDEPVRVEFCLSAESEVLASAMVDRIDSLFDIRIQPSFGHSFWRVVASITMIPSGENLRRFRARFEELADETSGTYEGWAIEYLPEKDHLFDIDPEDLLF